jgi:polyphosphate kinase 2 (PPK2 family)
MDNAKVISRARELATRHLVHDGAAFSLADRDPADTWPYGPSGKDDAQELLAESTRVLSELQEMLYAQHRWSLLVMFQAMDAAGKDGAIKHVMTGVNPQGCEIHAFKAPSAEERFRDLCAHEQCLAANGTMVRKIFLHVSKEEQRRRFLRRIDDPARNCKFSEADVAERAHWNAYMLAYEDAIRYTARPHAPWAVVPADQKWYTRLVVAAIMVDALASVDLHFPKLDDAAAARLAAVRAHLESE